MLHYNVEKHHANKTVTLQCASVEVTFVCSAPVSWPLLIGHTVMHPSKETEGGPLYPFLFSSPHPGGPSWSTSTSPITFTSWWEGGSGSLPDLSFCSQLYSLNSATECVRVPIGKWNYKSDLFNKLRFKKCNWHCKRVFTAYGRTWLILQPGLSSLGMHESLSCCWTQRSHSKISSIFTQQHFQLCSSCFISCFSYTVSNTSAYTWIITLHKISWALSNNISSKLALTALIIKVNVCVDTRGYILSP